jgi:hypothetical protein
MAKLEKITEALRIHPGRQAGYRRVLLRRRVPFGGHAWSGPGSLFFTGYDKDGDRAPSDDLFGYTPNKGMFYPRSPVSADDDDIDMLLLGELDDFLVFATGFGDDFYFRLILDTAQILIGEYPVTILLEGCLNPVQLFFGQVTFQVILIGIRRYDVEDIENPFISFGDAEGVIEGAIRIY